MIRDLSPKDLADVIGVSESSLKRWVDEGRLSAGRTAGGHRRIPLHEAIRFIRDTNASVTKPELLGFADLSAKPLEQVLTGGADAALVDALDKGDAELARGLILACHVKTRSVASVCDGPIAHAMHRVGEMWLHTDRGIMVEHRAVEICVEALHQIRRTLEPIPESAPTAVGCAPEGEPYSLPSLMAGAVLMETGYRDINLGPNTPINTLIRAISEYQPRLVWISVSTDAGSRKVIESLPQLVAAAAEHHAKLVLGGRSIVGAAIDPRIAANQCLSQVMSMAELAALARSLVARANLPVSTRAASDRASHNGHSVGLASKKRSA